MKTRDIIHTLFKQIPNCDFGEVIQQAQKISQDMQFLEELTNRMKTSDIQFRVVPTWGGFWNSFLSVDLHYHMRDYQRALDILELEKVCKHIGNLIIQEDLDTAKEMFLKLCEWSFFDCRKEYNAKKMIECVLACNGSSWQCEEISLVLNEWISDEQTS